METPITYNVIKGTRRRFAIGDVHGCAKTFKALLDKIALTTDDQVFILGDMINRGKRSKKVIKNIMQLQEQGYKIYPIRGNHEDQFVHYITEMPQYFYRYILKRNGLGGFLDSSGIIKPKYQMFFTTLPHYFELDTCFLVHAGFAKRNPLYDIKAMLAIRNMTPEDDIFDNKKIIHGHTPLDIDEIRKSIEYKYKIINIDNGCVLYKKQPQKGNLLCIDIDTNELFIQKNIDYS